MKRFLRCFISFPLFAPAAAPVFNEKGDWPWKLKLILWPADAEAKAMAGIYLKLSGQTAVAGDFLRQGGRGAEGDHRKSL